MKTLTIIRHAKSDWGSPGLGDHDRPLNFRGDRDAPRMGSFLNEKGISPEVVLSSTALRAITTAQIITQKLGFPSDSITEMREIYLASVTKLLEIVSQIDEDVDSAMMFGHNPGFHDLTCELVGSYNAVENFPTCSVACLKIHTDTWGEIGGGDAEIIAHFYPRMLRLGW